MISSRNKWLVILVVMCVPSLAFGRMITDDFEYADQAAFETAWPGVYSKTLLLSATTPLGTSKGLLSDLSASLGENARDFGDAENGTVSIDIYDAGGTTPLQFYVTNADAGGLLGIGITTAGNYQARIIGRDTGSGWFDTATPVARSIGKHTFAIAWAEIGVDDGTGRSYGGFYIDGVRVHNIADNSAEDFISRGFDTVQIGCEGTAGASAHAFDNLSIIPEPATAVTLLLSGGLSVMFSICKRTRRR